MARRPIPADPTAVPLTPAQRRFCLEYLKHGCNGTKAYQALHPNASPHTAATEAWEILRLPHVRVYLRSVAEPAYKALQIDAEDVLMRLGRAATADVRAFFDADGELLPPGQWPEELAQLVEGFDLSKGSIRLPAKAAVLRMLLEQSGKLKQAASVGDLAELLAGMGRGGDGDPD